MAETPTFSRQADKIFGVGEKRELIDFLAHNPLAGDEISGTGGVRKNTFCGCRARQAGRSPGDLLPFGRNNADLCATRLRQVR